MITFGDKPSTLNLVQVVDGIGSAIIGEDDPDTVFDVAQWAPSPEGARLAHVGVHPPG
jgi:hypothetical protein